MKQLTIYCSSELKDVVNRTLHKYEVEGFIHIPGIYGNKLKTTRRLDKDMTWEASAFVVFTSEKNVDGIVGDLQAFADACDIKPCLRMVVTPVEKIY